MTTVLRTLLDFATTASQSQLERAVRESHALWLVRRPELLAFVDHASGVPGAPALREALGREAASRSKGERAFLDLCRRKGLEPPLQNERVAGQSIDFFWPAHNLVVETDGYATHATRHGFEHDHEVDATLARVGVRVLRLTCRQIERRPDRVLETLRALGVRVLPR